MSSHVERLEARRRLLQAECAAQRGEIGAIHADLDAGVARADQLIAAVRRLTPVLLAGAAVATVVIGPGRLLGLARQGLVLGLLASRAGRLLR